MNKLLNFNLLLSLLILLFLGCQSIPKKPEGMKAELYEKYKRELIQGRKTDNKYEIGLALANLKQDKEKVYKLLNESAKTDLSACQKIMYFNKLYVNHGFETVLLQLDLEKWNALCELCTNVHGLKLFEDLYRKDSISREVYRNNFDSTHCDKELMSVLAKVSDDDQLYRSKREYDLDSNIRLLQKKLDKKNLAIVDSIIAIHHMPSVSLVSPKYNDVIWDVLQHQSEIEVRDKYYPFLVEANKNGLLADSLLYFFELRSARIGNSKFKYKL